jgi:hypothetical protein
MVAHYVIDMTCENFHIESYSNGKQINRLKINVAGQVIEQKPDYISTT